MNLATRVQHGHLDLEFVAINGRTVLLRERQQAPLQLVRPFTLDGKDAAVFIINPTAGVLAHDQFHIHLRVGPGAQVVLLTQTANRIHRMEAGQSASQTIHFEVACGGCLEYYPERTIPFAGSSFSSSAQVFLESGAQFAQIETLASGRVAHGEQLAFARLANQLQVWQDGTLVYLDRWVLQPAQQPLEGLGGWEGGCFLASGIFVGPTPAPAIAVEGAAVGQTAHGHLWLRALAKNGPQLDQLVARVRDGLRQRWFGRGRLVVRR